MSTVDLINRAREELDREYPQAWMPHEQGHPMELAGIVKRLERGMTRRFGEKPVLVIEDETGKEWSVWLMHAALLSQLERLRPAAGEAIAIRYLGKRMNQAGDNEYDDYKVVTARADGAQLGWGSPLVPDGPSAAGYSFPAGQQPEAAKPPAASGTPATGVCDACGETDGHSATCPYEIPY